MPMVCTSGWTEWINRGDAFTDASLASTDIEPLPDLWELVSDNNICVGATTQQDADE